MSKRPQTFEPLALQVEKEGALGRCSLSSLAAGLHVSEAFGVHLIQFAVIKWLRVIQLSVSYTQYY